MQRTITAAWYQKDNKSKETSFLLPSKMIAKLESNGLSSGSPPPSKQNYFIFMENFQKNQEKLINNQVKLANRIPLVN